MCTFGDGDVDILRPGPEMRLFPGKLKQNKGFFEGEKLKDNDNTVNMQISKVVDALIKSIEKLSQT